MALLEFGDRPQHATPVNAWPQFGRVGIEITDAPTGTVVVKVVTGGGGGAAVPHEDLFKISVKREDDKIRHRRILKDDEEIIEIISILLGVIPWEE